MQVIAGSAHTANRLALLYLLSYGYADGGAVGEQIVKCIVVQYLDVIPILAALGGDAFPFMAVAFSQSGGLLGILRDLAMPETVCARRHSISALVLRTPSCLSGLFHRYSKAYIDGISQYSPALLHMFSISTFIKNENFIEYFYCFWNVKLLKYYSLIYQLFQFIQIMPGNDRNADMPQLTADVHHDPFVIDTPFRSFLHR